MYRKKSDKTEVQHYRNDFCVGRVFLENDSDFSLK